MNRVLIYRFAHDGSKQSLHSPLTKCKKMLQTESPDWESKRRAGAIGLAVALCALALLTLSGGSIRAAPPAVLSVAGSAPGQDEPAPVPQSLGPKVYPLPIGPIMKQ